MICNMWRLHPDVLPSHKSTCFNGFLKKTLWISPGQFIGAYMPTNTIRLSRMEHHQPMGLFQVVKVIQAPIHTQETRKKNGGFTPSNPSFYTSFNSHLWHFLVSRSMFLLPKTTAGCGQLFLHAPKIEITTFHLRLERSCHVSIPFGGPAMLYTLMEWTCVQRNIGW